MKSLDFYDVIRIGIMLMAFLVAFYALISRERKTPSLIESIFNVIYIISLIMICILLIDYDIKMDVKNNLIIVLFLFILAINYHIHSIHSRIKNLRRDQKLKGSWVGLTIKNIKRRFKTQRSYEHFTSNISVPTSQKLISSKFIPSNKNNLDESIKLPFTAIYHLRSHCEADEILVDLASTFVNEGLWVQYTSCTRHPIEFLSVMKDHFENSNSDNDWEKKSRRIVAVDACTAHFGFTDSIYAVRSDDAKKMCLKLVKAKSSFAGIHTAAAEAFNHIKEQKKQISDGSREPTLVIYEGLHSLVDLESDQQYRIFYSHVLPSERLWGGMFTVVIEFSPSKENLDHIRTFGDIFYKNSSQFNTNLDKEI